MRRQREIMKLFSVLKKLDKALKMQEMKGNYSERVIGRYETDDLVISTAYVTDGRSDYETALSHLEYNNGNYIIVEEYKTKEKAALGHHKWVKTMRSNKLPRYLIDCDNSGLMGYKEKFKRNKGAGR